MRKNIARQRQCEQRLPVVCKQFACSRSLLMPLQARVRSVAHRGSLHTRCTSCSSSAGIRTNDAIGHRLVRLMRLCEFTRSPNVRTNPGTLKVATIRRKGRSEEHSLQAQVSQHFCHRAFGRRMHRRGDEHVLQLNRRPRKPLLYRNTDVGDDLFEHPLCVVTWPRTKPEGEIAGLRNHVDRRSALDRPHVEGDGREVWEESSVLLRNETTARIRQNARWHEWLQQQPR